MDCPLLPWVYLILYSTRTALRGNVSVMDGRSLSLRDFRSSPKAGQCVCAVPSLAAHITSVMVKDGYEHRSTHCPTS